MAAKKSTKPTPLQNRQIKKAISGMRAKTISSGAKFTTAMQISIRSDLVATIIRQNRKKAKKK